jgi:hypothetical protein
MADELPKVIPNTCADVKLLRVSYWPGLGEDSVDIEDLPIIAWTCEKSHGVDDWSLNMIPQTIRPSYGQSMDFVVYGDRHYGADGCYGGRKETIEQALVELRKAQEYEEEEIRERRKKREAAEAKGNA